MNNANTLWMQPAQRGPLLVAVVLACLLHLVNISVPTLAICLAMWGYHLLALSRPLPRPGAKAITAAGILFFLLAATTHEGVTVEAFVALLVLMIGLKLFELRHEHDATMAVILNYFVIVSGMFFSDSLLVTGYIALCLLYNTAVLVHVRHPGMAFRRTLRLAGRLILQALPFMLILFVFFPRFQGGLWGRPPLIQAQSGMTDSIRLGTIAALAESNEVAFRASFQGSIPEQGELYWRGLVLWDFDGLTWSRGRYGLVAEKTVARGTVSDYSVILEPHQQRWLYSLDRPLRVEQLRGVWMSGERILTTWRPVTSRLQYAASSDAVARLEPQPGAVRPLLQAGLRLPEEGNPRARALAREWQKEQPEAILARGLDFLRRGGFRYTLRPGALPAGTAPTDAIDALLFEQKAGFCEHYATAFAFLMRAAGVPARLVGGYLGGAVNDYGNYLIVRQSDAHVWCEVLVDGEWRRVDPTAVVAPARLRGTAEQLAADGAFSMATFFAVDRLPGWMQSVLKGWDLLNMRWNQWVMQYSFAEQRQFFARFGLDLSRGAGMISLLLGGFALIGIVYFSLLVFVRGKTREEDATTRQWRRFLRKLEQARIDLRPDWGPMRLLEEVAAARPDLAPAAERVVHLYIDVRYAGAEEDAAKKGALAEAVRRFRTRPQGRQGKSDRKR